MWYIHLHLPLTAFKVQVQKQTFCVLFRSCESPTDWKHVAFDGTFVLTVHIQSSFQNLSKLHSESHFLLIVSQQNPSSSLFDSYLICFPPNLVPFNLCSTPLGIFLKHRVHYVPRLPNRSGQLAEWKPSTLMCLSQSQSSTSPHTTTVCTHTLTHRHTLRTIWNSLTIDMSFHPPEPFPLQFPLNRVLWLTEILYDSSVQPNITTSTKPSQICLLRSNSCILIPSVLQHKVSHISVCITKTFPLQRVKLRNSINSCVFKFFNLSGQRLSFLHLLDKWPLEDCQLNVNAFKELFSRVLMQQVWRREGRGKGWELIHDFSLQSVLQYIFKTGPRMLIVCPHGSLARMWHCQCTFLC